MNLVLIVVASFWVFDYVILERSDLPKVNRAEQVPFVILITICFYCEHSTVDKGCLDRHMNGVHKKQGLDKCEKCEYSLIRVDDV